MLLSNIDMSDLVRSVCDGSNIHLTLSSLLPAAAISCGRLAVGRDVRFARADLLQVEVVDILHIEYIHNTLHDAVHHVAEAIVRGVCEVAAEIAEYFTEIVKRVGRVE